MAAVMKLPVSSTITLPILLNSRRVQEEGKVLIEFFWSDEVSPFNVALQTHIKYLYYSLKPTQVLKEKKEKFLKARIWLALLPYPQLLRIAPEQFTVKLESDI